MLLKNSGLHGLLQCACRLLLGRTTLAFALLAIGIIHAKAFAQAEPSTATEAYKAIKAPDALSKLGPELFGDEVNLYSGSLQFIQNDVSLRGNSALPVSMGRRLSVGRKGYADRPFGLWDVEMPYLSGVYAKPMGAKAGGWLGTDGSAARCSSFGPPPVADGLNGRSTWVAEEFWGGSSMYIPGEGEQRFLKRDPGYTASPHPMTVDGVVVNSFPIVTSAHWAIGCLPGLANDPSPNKAMGQGFVAVSPSGVRYKFDWMVLYEASTLSKPRSEAESASAQAGNTAPPADTGVGGSIAPGLPTPNAATAPRLPRIEVRLLPTKITDRFGNSVTYIYDPAHPANLVRIESNDGRVLTIHYEADNGVPSNRINAVSDGTRVWRYGYQFFDGVVSLGHVALPDGSRWDFSDTGGMLHDLTVAPPGECAKHMQPTPTVLRGSMVHPSGARGSFTLAPTEHGRSHVPEYCIADSIITPAFFFSNSLTTKSISGPGLAPLEWNYDYGSTNGSFAPCDGCVETKSVIVTEPQGNRTRYTFGNRFNYSEGKLLRTDVGWNGSTGLRTIELKYRDHPNGEYPERAGDISEIYGDIGTDSRFRPLDKRTTIQQNEYFVWEATSFDSLARPKQILRASSVGTHRSEITTYYDNYANWVIGQIASVQVPGYQFNLVDNVYDTFNANLLTTTRFGLLEARFNHHADGTLAARTDANGHSTFYSNYRAGMPQSTVYPDQRSESAEINVLGQVLSTTSTAGWMTGYEYDSMGRLSRIWQPTSASDGWHPTIINYAMVHSPYYELAAGHWRQETTTGNARETTYYDALWRPVYQQKWDLSDPAGTMSTVVRRYDHNGKLTFQSYPRRDVDSAVWDGVYQGFDALGRPTVTSKVSELGMLYLGTAYEDGFSTVTVDAKGNGTVKRFQAFDEPTETAIVSIRAPEGVNVDIARDPFGKPVSITRSGGGKSATRSYVYDASNQRLCKTIEPETKATVFEYDRVGNVTGRASGLDFPSPHSCDWANVPENKKITFTYDSRNRITKTRFGDGSPEIARSYTPDGLPEFISSGGTSWSYEYNNRRLNFLETLTYGGAVYQVRRGYDMHGSLASLSYPDNLSVSYDPNALGQPRQVGSYASNIRYFPDGAIQSFTYGNGILHEMAQNVRGLPERVIDAGVLYDIYSYDKNGNVGKVEDHHHGVNTRDMAYDNLDRLLGVGAVNLFGTAGYAYDALDNITGSTVTTGGTARAMQHHYDASNRLTHISGNAGYDFAYEYDAQGNIIQRGAQRYVFDLANRMQQATGKATYGYDGWNRRVSVVGADNVNRVQVYSQDGRILLSGPTNGVKTKYVYLENHLLAEVGTDTVYMHTDALGSPVARTDTGRGLISRTYYEPYGHTAAGAAPTIGFTGHVNDVDTGLTYMQQRYYDPIAGRMLSIDPVTTDANTGTGFNRYTYANNNPYKYIDPDGRTGVVALVIGVPVLMIGAYKYATDPQARAVINRIVAAAVSSGEGKNAPGTVGSDKGCIYLCDGVSPGQKTPSERPYVGSADDLGARAQGARDGREREGAQVIGEYNKGDRDGRRNAEQNGINEQGGKSELDNKRDEVDQKKWGDRGIKPPEEKKSE